MALDPEFSLARSAMKDPFQDPAQLERLLEVLRQAGFRNE